MLQKVVKYGNSRAVVLPKELLEYLKLDTGDSVNVERKDGCVIIQPVEIVPRLSEEDAKFVDDFYEENEAVFKALAE